MESDDAAASVAACKALLERGYGKPIQPVAFEPADMSDNELKRAVIGLAEQLKQEELIQ